MQNGEVLQGVVVLGKRAWGERERLLRGGGCFGFAVSNGAQAGVPVPLEPFVSSEPDET